MKAYTGFSVGLMLSLLSALLLVSALPPKAHAFPWGGQFNAVIPCFNAATWVDVGAPRGGEFIWVPGATQTYQYGAPSRAGQYGIGLAAPPYFCLVSPLPLIIFTGTIMTMVGTSQ